MATEAEIVEAILGGVRVQCPFCGGSQICQPLILGMMYQSGDVYQQLQIDWEMAQCVDCARLFHRNKPRGEAAYRVGPYWTTKWRDVYAAGRKRP